MRKFWKSMAGLGLALAATAASAQTGWFYECIDPENEQPYSDDYGRYDIGNDLIHALIGLSGNVTYGGQNGPCYAPSARTLDASGRFGYYVGSEGSLQTDFDNFQALTMGAPNDPVGDYTYAKILKGGNTNASSVLFGDGGLYSAYVGASKRYAVVAWADGDVDVQLQVKVIGNAVRNQWRIRNLSAESLDLGLLWGSYVGMRTSGGQRDRYDGTNQAHSALGTRSGFRKGFDTNNDRYLGFIRMPTGRPVRNERRYDSSSPRFPTHVDFLWGQAEPYGIRVENTPGSSTPDATAADLIVIGNQGAFTSPGLLWGNQMRLNVFGDSPNNPAPAEEADIFLNETAYIQRFPASATPSGAVREIVHYIRTNWSVGDYRDPYAFLLDPPRLLQTDANGLNGLSPNPLTLRAYVDNQYATLDREVDLRNVRFSIFLPTGLKLADGELQQKTVDLIASNSIGSVDWNIVADGKVFGDLPVRVSVSPTPGPAKELTAIVKVAATPKLDLPAGANLVTIPYSFQDSSFESILGLQSGVDFVAYRWDTLQNAYIPASTVERGTGYWIVPKNDLSFYELKGALLPNDAPQGGLTIRLQQGWNLIGNPYSYEVPITDLLVVAEDTPEDGIPWIEAVGSGFVQSSLAYWKRDESLPGGGQYVFTEGVGDVLKPHTGYFVFWQAFKPGTIVVPPVFIEGLDNSRQTFDKVWKQTDREWRLQLSARTAKGIDSRNYVGVMPDAKKAEQAAILKPPAAPQQNVELYIEDQKAGMETRFATAVSNSGARKEWTVKVKANEPGEVTVTWPNLPSVPRNMRFRLEDPATKETRDLRATSGYTFRMAESGTRTLKLTMEPGGSARPVIGNVVVSRPGRGLTAPISVTYALSADALVSVRVLSNTGKEVFTITRGRADNAGQNSVSWAMRDKADRAVAPGVYRVEILAETPNGERVRKIVPVNVVR